MRGGEHGQTSVEYVMVISVVVVAVVGGSFAYVPTFANGVRDLGSDVQRILATHQIDGRGIASEPVDDRRFDSDASDEVASGESWDDETFDDGYESIDDWLAQDPPTRAECMRGHCSNHDNPLLPSVTFDTVHLEPIVPVIPTPSPEELEVSPPSNNVDGNKPAENRRVDELLDDYNTRFELPRDPSDPFGTTRS